MKNKQASKFKVRRVAEFKKQTISPFYFETDPITVTTVTVTHIIRQVL